MTLCMKISSKICHFFVFVLTKLYVCCHFSTHNNLKTKLSPLYLKHFIWHFVKKFESITNIKRNHHSNLRDSILPAQTRGKSDQNSAIQKKFVIWTMVIMNTKEATADFWILGKLRIMKKILLIS